MTEEQILKLKKTLQENRKSLNIARLPDKTKEEFVNLANESFVGDYGWCLKWCLEQALEYQAMKNTFFQNIDMKLDLILNSQNQPEEEEKGIKMADGREIKIKREVK